MTWTGCDCPICQNTEIEAHRDELVAARDVLFNAMTDKEAEWFPEVLPKLDEVIASAEASLDALLEAQQACFEQQERFYRLNGFYP